MAVLRVLVLAGVLCAAAPAAHAATITIRPAGSTDLNQDTVLAAGVGSPVDLEIVLDTQGLTLEGYSYGLDFAGGSIAGLVLSHAALTPLVGDAFGPAIPDAAASTIRNINQAKLSAGPGLAAGVYVLDSLSFMLAALDAGSLTVTGGLHGEVFGLGEGVCPQPIPGCSVQFFSLQIIPEPASAALLAAGLGALATRRRRPRSTEA